MTLYIVLALFNGILIAVARLLNGRLATHSGAFYSSWINHIGGFLFLSILLLFSQGFYAPLNSIPWYLYFGGVIGGLYVGLNSFVTPKLGATLATLLVIAGQLIVSVVVDIFLGNIRLNLNWPSLQLVIGCLMLVAGFYLMSVVKDEKRSN
ncbi:DMT family transporter [Reinekea marina]|uniref:DMT family transporter n=1 Tax=Reinekea marina TaxID=1310421 RepID=A0ABV7WYV0_9GAMM|nr:DMT family transporter [Reinekea marina]MBU2864314.1 DMT family transporter [Reinekea forsetii]MDN3647461.1 DMT family transporter [Reinekea marina]